MLKQCQHQLADAQGKLDETHRTINDLDTIKNRLIIENSDLLRQLEEATAQVSQLSKMRISLTSQLEDTKRMADEESRVSQECVQCRKWDKIIIIKFYTFVAGTNHFIG